MDLKIIEDRFEKQLSSVDELKNFDKIVLDLCIRHIESLNDKLKSGPFEITNPTYLAESTLKVLKNVRTNNSLAMHYKSMYNSCVVLQVSYFVSILNDIFRSLVTFLASNNIALSANESIKFTLTELAEFSYDISNHIGDILLNKQNISFQDMHSTCRTFKKYFGIEIVRNNICNTIILAQASRHVIVHNNSIVDDRFMNQIRGIEKFDIKNELKSGDSIQFTPSELEFVKISMLEFVSNLIEMIKGKFDIVEDK